MGITCSLEAARIFARYIGIAKGNSGAVFLTCPVSPSDLCYTNVTLTCILTFPEMDQVPEIRNRLRSRVSSFDSLGTQQ
ncbi:hypothetical protein ACRALDRAFT_211637 [Sodiomyces alcalophilus JCM 7366]|uniref:uncharacterized protein n=1 Tax=Sodiomyces alcalophilus JCM 7366 TaxID=591952 RepID=UPI0039B5EBF5